MNPRPLHAPFFSTYLNGYRAGCEGQPSESNPYSDIRKGDGRLTWSRAWLTAWDEGYEDGKAGKPLRYKKKVKA